MHRTHLTSQELTAYCACRLPPYELLGAKDHLAGCPVCRAVLRRAEETPPMEDSESGEAETCQVHGRVLDGDFVDGDFCEIHRPQPHDSQDRAELEDLAHFRERMSSLPLHNSSFQEEAPARKVPHWQLLLLTAVLLAGTLVTMAGVRWFHQAHPVSATPSTVQQPAR